MKLSVTAKLVLGIGTSLLLVAFVGLSSYLSLKGIEEDYQWVLHTEKVINKNTELIALIREAESSQRGYIFRHNPDYLNEYNSAIKKLEGSVAELVRLVSDNEGSYALVKQLEKLIQQKMVAMADLIAIKDKTYSGVGTDETIGLQAKVFMDEIEVLIQTIRDKEETLLNDRQTKTQESIARTVIIIILGTLLIFLIVLILFKNISKAFKAQKEARKQIDEANAELKIQIDKNADKNWVLTGTTKLNNRIQGELSVQEIAQIIIQNIAEYAGSKIGAIYLVDEDDKEILNLTSGYAFSITANTKKRFNYSESWIGQAAKDGKAITVNGDLIQNLDIKTGLVQTKPIESMIVPFYYGSELQGLIEIGFIEPITERIKTFVTKTSELIGIVINTAKSREILHSLYQQTQQQAEELESQQEELRVSNEELLSKTELLQASEEELRVQQEELRQINAELEEKARILDNSNQQITAARDTLSLKMKELEQANKYKTEFLANMSHELRTPLNSILILARILKDNKGERLSEEEIKYANVIFRAGTDLLSLINDILDLSKIESGFIELNEEKVSLNVLENDLKMLFDEVAINKGVNFVIKRSADVPSDIHADLQRLEQILKNLLSNAFKFTPKGGTVEVNFYLQNNRLSIAVKDTGIGIPPDKQKIIFEAFQQADGSTNREYGGTGLGLSISRELSRLMKADIVLDSEQGKGSTFTLSFPLEKNENQLSNQLSPTLENPVEAISNISEKRFAEEETAVLNKHPERKVPKLMIIEDDIIFNDLLKEYASKSGFETLQYYSGDGTEEEIEKHLPDAILLDVMLPGKDGWEVLKGIKANPKISYIPVHIMSAGDFSDKKAVNEGAISFLKKPVEEQQLNMLFKEYVGDREENIRKVLLVEDQVVQSDALKELFKEKSIVVAQAFTGKEAITKLKEEEFDCVILDLNLPDIDGIELLEIIKEEYPKVPVIINTAMELEQEKLKRLLKYSDATVIKSPKSGDRLIDEVNLFLHKVKETSGTENKKVQISSASVEKDLNNKTVLLVDDDMRNIFALSAILDQYGLKVEIANDGLEGLNKLKELKKVDIVLMDIMMPGMDGYETMRNIRKNHQWKNLPIIALTAKAMKDDREKSIAAGANDYISKPVDTDQLIALIKIWIS